MRHLIKLCERKTLHCYKFLQKMIKSVLLIATLVVAKLNHTVIVAAVRQ